MDGQDDGHVKSNLRLLQLQLDYGQLGQRRQETLLLDSDQLILLLSGKHLLEICIK